jgi:hypothetical protein
MPLNSVFSWFMKKRFHQMELFIKYPIEVQNDVFDRLMQQGRYSEWGKKYGYADIGSWKDYSKRVPLQTYEDLKPFVQRLKSGEQGLLWPTEINWFAKSSGTTSDKSKFIPVSREALEDCHFKGGKDLLAVYNHNHPTNNLYKGKSLVLGGSSQINEFRKDSYYGDLSAIIINNLPIWVEFKRIPDRQIALMDKWEEKIEVMANSVKYEDVTNMAGVPSWTLVLLKRILEMRGAKYISEIWPNLELYMHGGVNFEPYRSQFDALMGPQKVNYYENYNASEGFFGIQDQISADGMLLMLDYGIFFEFIPAENAHEDQPKTLTLEDVEVGKNYELVISTNAGLWRYRLGDTVSFTSLRPFRIKVTGRTKLFINAFGEELMIDNAEKAIANASSICNCMVSDYTAGPIYMTNEHQGGHEWLIEFEREPDNLEAFTDNLDSELKRLNSDYEAKRTGDLTLRRPLVRPLPKGTFYNWLRSKGKLGGQHKVPRLANHRDFIDQIGRNIAVEKV